MRVLSMNVGLPRDVVWHGRTVTTGIYKQPVSGRIALRKLNLDGDRQADLTDGLLTPRHATSTERPKRSKIILMAKQHPSRRNAESP